MAEAAHPALIAMSSDIVAAYVANKHAQASEVPALIPTVHAALACLGASKPVAAELEKLTPAVSVRKSITDEHLVSLEDGKRYKSLKRHLSTHSLTPDEYRVKWNLPIDYPMVAPAYARAGRRWRSRWDSDSSAGSGEPQPSTGTAAARAAAPRARFPADARAPSRR